MQNTITAAQQALQNMHMLDDFLYNEVASDETFGQEFFRILAQRILGIRIRHVHIQTQKVQTPGLPGLHGIRMDMHIDRVEAAPDQRVDITISESGSIPHILDIEPNKRLADKLRSL